MHRREEKNPETTAVAGPKIIRSLNSEGVKGIVNSSSSGSGQSVKETFHCPWGEVELERAAKWPRNYVKVLEILGYHPRPCVDQHVKFLIENLVGLEKIIQHWCWDIRLVRHGGKPDKEAEARDHAMQNLKQKLPSTVEFVCN
ncbi:hypothetical protein ACFX13_000862 [Malus domestica]